MPKRMLLLAAAVLVAGWTDKSQTSAAPSPNPAAASPAVAAPAPSPAAASPTVAAPGGTLADSSSRDAVFGSSNQPIVPSVPVFGETTDCFAASGATAAGPRGTTSSLSCGSRGSGVPIR
jgi:hypothetical protein